MIRQIETVDLLRSAPCSSENDSAVFGWFILDQSLSCVSPSPVFLGVFPVWDDASYRTRDLPFG